MAKVIEKLRNALKKETSLQRVRKIAMKKIGKL
jgi:hypothetical protein